MFISLIPVKQFTTVGGTPSKSTQTTSGVPEIYSLRHLRNLKTAHTNPVVEINHGQTAMLALLNGIRSEPAHAKPMPIGFKSDPEGGNYSNDGDYDATEWGLEHSNMTLYADDFKDDTNKLVALARGDLDESSIVADGMYMTDEEACRVKILKDEAEKQRLRDEACGVPQPVCLDSCPCDEEENCTNYELIVVDTSAEIRKIEADQKIFDDINYGVKAC